MSIVWIRRISQLLFLSLFVWFCIVLTPGDAAWQWTGWPYNALLQLDPLVAVATVLATGALYAGLAWAAITLLFTLLFGRVFCGWICPMGTLHQAIGFLGRRAIPKRADRANLNRPHPAQAVKYGLLAFLLALGAGGALRRAAQSDDLARSVAGLFIAGLLAAIMWVVLLRKGGVRRSVAGWIAVVLLLVAATPAAGPLLQGSLQTGLLDPIPLLHRSVQLVVLPWADQGHGVLFTSPRHYAGAGLIGFLFLAFLLLNLWRPRFYCRFICPLGALLGSMAPLALFRPAKKYDECTHCRRCEEDCEGACDPDGELRLAECVACMNCLRACPDSVFTYRAAPSASGEIRKPDVNRRGLLAAAAAGVLAPAAARLSAWTGDNWRWRVLRPPGSLREDAFLERCLKCGQCMRVCPTNIIQPAGMEAGLEGLWTPVLNYRIGSSGCQTDCTACGAACPTSAIRPITPDERTGRGSFEGAGPLRIGTAFVDHGRCLPWTMETPCIVCQEVCPVRPKAIHIRHEYRTVRGGAFTVEQIEDRTLIAQDPRWEPEAWAKGDYRARPTGDTGSGILIEANTANRLVLQNARDIKAVREWEIIVHLQQPVVDPRLCIGCGICEHECPVSGLRAIRVSAENESRDPRHTLLTNSSATPRSGPRRGGGGGGGGGRGSRRRASGSSSP